MAFGKTCDSPRAQTIRVFVSKLVAVPLVGVLALAAMVLRPRFEAANTAAETKLRMERTSLAVGLSSVVAGAQLPWIVKATADGFGLPPQLVEKTLGFDPNERTRKGDAAIEMYFADHPDDEFLQAKRDEWRTLRKGFQSDSSAVLFRKFTDFQADLRQRWDLETSNASEISAVSSQLERDVEMVSAILALSESNTKLYESMFEILGGSDAEQMMSARVRVASAAALFDAAQERVAQLSRLLDVPTNGLDQLRSAEATRRLKIQIDFVTSGHPVQLDAAGIGRIAETVNGGIERNGLIERLVANALKRSTHTAAKLRDDTKNTLRTTIALIVGLLVITGFLFFRVSKAMTRPLDVLAGRARNVAQGEFDLGKAPKMGPREIQMVSGVLDELVANLRRVQRQAGALATGSFDDAVFRETIPGPIGQMIAASVSRLSRSIREREELQEKLAEQATHDSLTGLPNRAAAMMALEQALARNARRSDELAVMFVDLDEFKRVNDQRGHGVGDDALRLAADRILGSVRTGDVVARLGGDEFLVIAETFESKEAIQLMGQRIVASVSEPMEIDGAVVRIGASIGVAFPDGTKDNASDLLGRADLAMYHAKSTGRGRVVEFSTDLSKMVEERRTIEEAMAQALSHDELRLVYQPVVNAKNESVGSVEALLRWHRPGAGEQSPARFIPILEASPLMIDVGRWVLCRAAIEVQQLRRRPEFASLGVAVNMSGRHLLHNTVVDDVQHALALSGLTPSALTIEITETSLVTDLATAVEHVKQLRALGVRVAIDDFGTGYTSIGQLSRLPVNILKIDRSFVDQIGVLSSRRIVELIIELGHTLGMEVVAEGVEDLSQLESLRDLHCDSIQGFLFSPPVAPEELRSSLNLTVGV